MEFSGVRPPKLAMVTEESVGLLKRSSSEQVPKNTLPFALKWASRPEPAGAGPDEGVLEGGFVLVAGGGGGGACVAVPVKHWE